MIQIANLQFSTDYWVHAAAIAEFANNPLEPSHTFVSDQVPHHALNVYHFVLGSVAALLGVSVVRVTQVFGAINAAAFLILFPQFVKTFVNKKQAPVIALLLTTLAWGPLAWRYSGFLNLNSIGFGAPYPSFFAVWVSLLLVWILRRFLAGRGQIEHLLLLGVGGFLVANSHPITFGGLSVITVALLLEHRSLRAFAGAGALMAGALGGAMWWPFFDLLGAVGRSRWLDAENAEMYRNVFSRTAPALFGLLPLAYRFRRNHTDALVWTFLFSVTIYIAGLALDRATYGRILPFAVLALHLAMADGMTSWYDTATASAQRITKATASVLVVLGLVLASPAVVRMLPPEALPGRLRADLRLETDFEWVIPADSLINYGDVVLAPPDISTQFASTGAKLVTFRRVDLIHNQDQRRMDAIAFFNNPSSGLLEKYQVDWIAFRNDGLEETVRDQIEALGPKFDLGRVSLIQVTNDTPLQGNVSGLYAWRSNSNSHTR